MKYQIEKRVNSKNFISFFLFFWLEIQHIIVRWIWHDWNINVFSSLKLKYDKDTKNKKK